MPIKVLWINSFPEGSGEFRLALFNELKTTCYIREINIKTKDLVSFFRSVLVVRAESKNYDVVHAQYGSTCILACILSVKPVVLTIRGSDWNIPFGADFKSISHSLLARIFTVIGILKSRLVITVSAKIKQSIFLSKKTVAIPDLLDHTELNSNKSIALSRGDNTVKILFGSFARKNSIKNIELARKSVDHFKRKYGSSYLCQLFEIQSASRGEFLRVLSSCDVLLMTSHQEGFPNVVKEALYYGISVVSTDVSDLLALTSVYPNLFIADKKPDSFADAIREAILFRASNLSIPPNLFRPIWLDPQRQHYLLNTLYKSLIS